MSKHTVFVEAPPFAKFSDAEMRRLLDDERLEVLDWRGKRVNTPGFVEALATADIAVTGNSLTITDELLEKLPNLKLIAKLGTGLDMIDIPSVLRRGILLCNTPGANSVAVAEHTFALLLGYLRNVPQCDNAVRTGQWEKTRTMGGEICGKTVGISATSGAAWLPGWPGSKPASSGPIPAGPKPLPPSTASSAGN